MVEYTFYIYTSERILTRKVKIDGVAEKDTFLEAWAELVDILKDEDVAPMSIVAVATDSRIKSFD